MLEQVAIFVSVCTIIWLSRRVHSNPMRFEPVIYPLDGGCANLLESIPWQDESFDWDTWYAVNLVGLVKRLIGGNNGGFNSVPTLACVPAVSCTPAPPSHWVRRSGMRSSQLRSSSHIPIGCSFCPLVPGFPRKRCGEPVSVAPHPKQDKMRG